MAIAVEELAPAAEQLAPTARVAASAAAGRPRRSSSQRGGGVSGRQVRQLAGGASRVLPTAISGRSSVLPRLITAAFLGLLVLEVVSYVTGHYFNYDLRTPLRPTGDGAYHPLYQGQQLGQSNPHVNPPLGNEDKSYTIPSAWTNPVAVGSIVARQGASAPGFGV